ncbi:YHYH domain-containing protein [Pseudalkalibacillus sp. R45]|uniref:YHYH domain-containing protein n=1 Tax=Pseudalkalibacillus sp. R45 TaxID=3457433 RepID=UPI003FCDFF0C
MRKLFSLLLTIILIVSTSDFIYAHSGRTDSSGGHNCSEKSKAKGLCTGYHYHNGGGSSSGGSSSAGTSSTQSSDKDCSDFASYDEVVEYWNKKGYSKTNDPERLDGWGNTVDDGIPCEVPSGYDTSKINGSPEQIAKQNAEKDKANGEAKGFDIGYQDGYNEKDENPTTSKGSDAYKEGFKTGYIKGFKDGTGKITGLKEQAEEAGYKLGQKTDKIDIPTKYSQNVILKATFEKGFKEAVSERVKEKEDEYREKGYNNGKNDTEQNLNDLEENYLKAYQDGYEKGQKELRDEYYKKGYNDAFKMLDYKQPNFLKEKYTKWYKEGFESNNDVIEIQDEAYELGLSGEKLYIPEKYIKSEEIFNHYFELGAIEYQEEQRQENAQTTVGMGVLLAGWLARRFYVAKKMIA